MKRIFLIALLSLIVVCALAQTTKEEMFSNLNYTGGVYLAYPEEFPQLTNAPKGYKPFYITHYGRHGSRYLISDNDYTWLIDLFKKADESHALTALGQDVYQRLLKVWEEAAGHGGDLTPLGTRQHQGIAERMYHNFPDVFKNGGYISARSTIVLRCAMSMVAFGDRLKQMNPNLQIYYEASNKYMDYMNFHTAESNQFTSMSTGPLAEEFRKFKEAHTNGERLTSSLFSDPDFIRMQVNPSDLIWGLYWVASDAQCTENKISFYDIFQPQELFDIWQCSNYQFYVNDANHTAGNEIVISNAKPLLKNIVESADEAINHPENVATLRFGHDGNVIPLIALMQIENFNVSVSDPAELYKYWCNFKTAPMAGNVQIVFFKKEKGDGDILVKILLHEKEVHIPVPTNMFPYYKWEDVRNYFMNRIEK